MTTLPWSGCIMTTSITASWSILAVLSCWNLCPTPWQASQEQTFTKPTQGIVTNTQSRFASVVLGPPQLVRHTWPRDSLIPFKVRLRTFEVCRVSSKSPSRVRDELCCWKEWERSVQHTEKFFTDGRGVIDLPSKQIDNFLPMWLPKKLISSDRNFY